jgi:hypothetical protein
MSDPFLGIQLGLIIFLLRYHFAPGASVAKTVAPSRGNARPVVFCQGFALVWGRSEPHRSLAQITSRAVGCDGRSHN